MSWTVATTDANGFDVLRETWNSRKRSLGQRDDCGDGTGDRALHRGYERRRPISVLGAGQEFGGVSGYAGPAPVTVTSVATSTTSPAKRKKR